jgi:hypothetical protein
MKKIFEGSTQVAIQGERVLRFIDFSENQAKYEIIGFEDSPVTLIDHRLNGLLAIQSLLETGDLYNFAPNFNHPALVIVTQDEMGEVVIELNDTEDSPSCVLWIAIGLGHSLPVYDYIYENIVPLAEVDKYALITIYQIPSSDKPASLSRDFASAISSSSSVTWVG